MRVNFVCAHTQTLIYMKKTLFVLLTLLSAAVISAKDLYLNTGGSSLWNQAGAKFAIWSWTGSGNGTWSAFMNQYDGDIFVTTISDNADHVIFARINSDASAPDWNKVWNQTEDLSLSTKNMYTITGWGQGEGAKSTGTWGTAPAPKPVDAYIAGNGTDGNPWCCGLSWKEDGCKMENNTITFDNVPAGQYAFKITDGTWDRNWGYAAVDATTSTKGYVSDADGNVVFTIDATATITITFANNKIQLVSSVPFVKSWARAVPTECEDVMMQGFYWDSYHVDKESAPATVIYGDTKWETLYKQSGEIGAYFDLIWLPPSAFSSGGVGYLPKQYSKQNSDWGNRTSLEKLINAFHNSGTKVIADIVVNHLDYKSSGCDFYENDFGEFGKFQPDYTWITKNDEIWGSGNAECKTPGPNAKDDDGYGPYDERNYNGARDLDHDGSEDVRKMVRAYEQWMIKEMKYDGFRYDYCKGFHGSHINDYNNTSKPYLSVMEYWSSLDAIMNCIKDADYNTMAFDFQTKYAAFNDAGKPGQGIVSGNYSGCKGSGMLGAGFAQYAVTFVDNHDTFERDDNEFGGKGNSMKPALKDKLMQANAFILGMPGVPCVFYPHWYKYKEDIKPMINARHMAGVHSQSQVKDEYCDDGGYQATIVGHHGYLILCLGNKAGQSFDGFQKVAFGNGYAMWVQVSGNQAPKLQVTPSNIFRDKEQGMTVEVKAVGGSCNKPTVYYTVDGTEPTTSSESFEASKTFVFKDSTVLKVMAACGNAFSQVQSYHYDYVEPQKEGIIVKFNAPEDWERVFIYAWDTKNEMITPGFPGQELFQQPDGWYQYQFEYGKDTVNFKFSMGRAGACSTDQQTVMDVCYEWDEQNGDAVKVACGEIVVPLNVVASPSSCKFADATKGIDVKVWAVSNEPAKIYYTLNGAEPTEQSQMAWDSVSFTLNQTTEVKAFAVCGKEKSPVKTFTYVYHEQKGAITIRFFNTSNWEKVYYYAWIPGATKKDKVTELLGAWPGTEIKTKDGDWYTYTFDAKYTQFSLIFDAGKDAAQTSDLTIVSDGCYEWRENLNDVVENVGCLVTGIEQVMIEPRNNGHKLMIDGQLYIQHNNHMFNIFGLQVK